MYLRLFLFMFLGFYNYVRTSDASNCASPVMPTGILRFPVGSTIPGDLSAEKDNIQRIDKVVADYEQAGCVFGSSVDSIVGGGMDSSRSMPEVALLASSEDGRGNKPLVLVPAVIVSRRGSADDSGDSSDRSNVLVRKKRRASDAQGGNNLDSASSGVTFIDRLGSSEQTVESRIHQQLQDNTLQAFCGPELLSQGGESASAGGSSKHDLPHRVIESRDEQVVDQGEKLNSLPQVQLLTRRQMYVALATSYHKDSQKAKRCSDRCNACWNSTMFSCFLCCLCQSDDE